ncbi:YbaB/EbfC family nucleoid-associated protein [Nocardia sp. NBC_00565]|uniref:YbaB/EbfC family nucleoid-associated protein n=1 Tax=Nocardia sp. NBC_00565 TaxID=2975993 RepID=UPI002E80DC41|nr:YbaB/EbfC family nucleoid-associated protein [Nocardia sp. NBC_00565]WUC02861.1 YbaB/EbfC family nucleoid-associated protein [Nocardia sp. NBC_00565]
MANEFAKAEMAAVLDEVQQQFRAIAQVQQQRAELIASATVRKRVTVTVNADGTIVETKFASDIDELSYGEIAKAVTEAAQKATAEVTRKAQELMMPLHDRRARLPKLSDLVEGMPDLSTEMPMAPKVSLAPPNADERRAAAAQDSAPMEFSDVEVVSRQSGADRGVTDSSW